LFVEGWECPEEAEAGGSLTRLGKTVQCIRRTARSLSTDHRLRNRAAIGVRVHFSAMHL